MVISSLIVETLADKTHEVAQALATISGVEVHGTQDYQVIVTIEADTVNGSHAIASEFISIPGVSNVNLIYANFEDDPYLKEQASK